MQTDEHGHFGKVRSLIRLSQRKLVDSHGMSNILQLAQVYYVTRLFSQQYNLALHAYGMMGAKNLVKFVLPHSYPSFWMFISRTKHFFSLSHLLCCSMFRCCCRCCWLLVIFRDVAVVVVVPACCAIDWLWSLSMWSLLMLLLVLPLSWRMMHFFCDRNRRIRVAQFSTSSWILLYINKLLSEVYNLYSL